MEVYIGKQRLQEEMSILSNVTEKKSSIPILENCLLYTEGPTLKLKATDLDLSMFSQCTPERIEGEGTLCVPTRRIFDIVRLLPEGIVKIIGDPNQWVKIQAKGSTYKIPGANPEMFPPCPKVPDDWMYISGKLLRNGLKGVGFASSTSDDNRFAIGGVKIEVSEVDIKLVATDGHRIARASSDLEDLIPTTLDSLLPGKCVNELGRLLSDYNGQVGISAKENGLFFQIGDRVLHSRLLVGKFPAYESSFETPYPFVAGFKADVLAQSLRRSVLVSDDKLNGVTFSFNNGKVVLTSQDADKGECEEILDSNFNGGELRIALSAKYMLDYLDEMGSEPVRFDIKDGSYPIHLQTTKDGTTYRYILIPLRDKGK